MVTKTLARGQARHCNGDDSLLEGNYHYICPCCSFRFCYTCFEKILIAETGCPNCLAPLVL
nr:hypothetical protein [Candidatus Sigynarchaeota archaeon]